MKLHYLHFARKLYCCIVCKMETWLEDLFRKGERMNSAAEQKTKNLNIRIPEELHRELKVKAAEQGKSMAFVVERLIKAFLQAPDPQRLFELDLK